MSHAGAIAIVGLGGVFPGATDLEAFWRQIVEGRSASVEVPAERWVVAPEAAYSPTKGTPDRVYSRRACVIRDFRFDPTGFTIAPELLGRLDPLFHLALHAGREAWGQTRHEGLDPRRVGVIIGNIVLPSETASAIAQQILGTTFEEAAQGTAAPQAAVEPLNRYVAGLPGGVLAKALGLGGGSYTLDAACASSLYALKLAVEELRAGRADAMLTGGVSRPDNLYTQMGFAQLRALSPSGTCSPFDHKGDGLVVGEGAGILVLKRLEDAIAAGDTIHAVIRGIGLSNDIDGSLLAPSNEGQVRAMRQAYTEAGWAPADVDLIECHATGTPLGDGVEFGSLKTLWAESEAESGQCVLGSVKGNIGHLLTAAGSAGLIKLIQAMQQATLPPTANFERASETVALEGSPFKVLTSAQPWPERAPGVPRRAAISAFGFGGINAHVLLEAPPHPDKAAWTAPLSSLSPTGERGKDTPLWGENGTSPLPGGGEGSSGAVQAALVGEGDAQRAVPIAIVGMATRFGGLHSLREFQEAALGGNVPARHRVTTPAGRWWGAEQTAWFRAQGLADRPWPGFYLDGLDAPVGRFRIPPKELAEMLPQQLLMLLVAAEAVDDAQLADTGRERAGVFVGIGLDLNTTNFHVRWALDAKSRAWGADLPDAEREAYFAALRESYGPALSANRTLGALGGMVASRVARELRIGGPSFTISSEESSGLRALEAGLRALQRGELDSAVVGAVDLAGDLRAMLMTHAHRPFGTGDRPRPFDESADGTLPGEGACAVILKRLDDALRDGDRIYAVIKGLGAANGGAVHERAPEPDAYAAAVARAYQEAGVTPQDVTLLETHGSGDPAEDHLEATALAACFQPAEGASVALGTLKSVIGHTGAAAGLAGLVKASLCLYQEILPESAAIDRPLAPLAEASARFHAPRQAQYWLRDRARGPRRAAVSAMSVDGNCVHVVLEGVEDARCARPEERRAPLGVRPEALFALEGPTARLLDGRLAALDAWIGGQPSDRPIEALARDWFQAHPLRHTGRAVAIVAKDAADLRAQIAQVRQSLAEDPTRPLGALGTSFYAPEPLGPQGELAFVYPGSGSHYAGMGASASAYFPEILRRIDGETAHLKSQMAPELAWPHRLSWPTGWAAEAEARLNADHQAVLFAQVGHGALMTELVGLFGLQPKAVIGYSLGETAGFVSTRAWPDRDDLYAKMQATSLFTEDLAGECRAAAATWNLRPGASVSWRLGVVDRPKDVVLEALAGLDRAYLLIVNAPSECVIGGDRAAIEALVARLECTFVPLEGVTTVHCEVVGPVADRYRELHRTPTAPPEGVRYYSGARGSAYAVDRESAAEAITAQALEGIDFTRVIRQAYADGVRLFVELGPRNSCSRMIKAILGDRPHIARSACVRGQDDFASLLRLLAQLIAERVPIDLTALYGLPSRAVGLEPLAAPGPTIAIPLGGKPFDPPRKPARPAPLAALPVAPSSIVAPAPAPVAPSRPSPTRVDAAVAILPSPVPAPRPVVPPVPAPSIAPSLPHLTAMLDATTATAEAHEVFLRLAADQAEAQMAVLRHQTELLGALMGAASLPVTQPMPVAAAPLVPAPLAPAKPAWRDREACLEFARGTIAKVLGEAFAEIDAHPTRVRLPDEPLMLVDRILEVTGEPRSMTSGTVVTEHDIHPGAWYLDGGRIPTCIAVEAGQADLFLSGYLGIDFQTKGLACYRLLDAVVTFHRGLPGPGEVIRYDIAIERFMRQGDTYLFFFHFEATVDGEPLLSMRKGCAGFFTPQQLAEGKGIVFTALDLQPMPGKRPADWRALVPMAREAYSSQQIEALRHGQLAAAFGPAFQGLALNTPITLPDGRMRLVDRVIELDPTGGRYGLGFIRAEADIHPDDWFITCHFVDDMVMPGTLMYECCMHTLRIFLMRMGWVGEAAEVHCEPVPGVASQLKCRGQVLATTKVVTYEISIKELGYGPEPYAIADALMLSDGHPIVHITNMSVRMPGLSQEKLQGLWAGAHVPAVGAGPAYEVKPAVYGPEQILAYAIGNPSEGFGDRYKVFDAERIIARLPGPPYMFLDRITEVTGEPWVCKAGASCEGQYDVPVDAWYFGANGQATMPFAVLLEVALQPCGWLAAYVGSALTSEQDLSFRNLGGQAVQYEEITPYSGTLTIRVKLKKVSQSVGMVIQEFDMEVTCQGRLVYRGDTSFGFFTKAALSQQVGVRGAALYAPAPDEASAAVTLPLSVAGPLPMPGEGMLMLDDATFYPGGPHGLGYIRGTRRVDPDEWFFKAHFYQDPVCPGSLGLESMLQLMRAAAHARWADAAQSGDRFECVTLHDRHAWLYRGQYTPVNQLVTVEAVIKRIDDATRTMVADGHLMVDGTVIYQMTDFALRVVGG